MLTNKSENVLAFESNPITVNNNFHRGDHLVDRALAVPTTVMDTVGDKIFLGPIRSNAIILDLMFLNDALAASGLAYDIGVYRTDGTVVDVDCIGSAVAFSSARITPASLRFEAADIISVKQELWQLAGLTSDPGGHFYIGLTCTTVATTPAVGDIVMIAELL
jgi:hypothetical protein